jgi:hypothetical protein
LPLFPIIKISNKVPAPLFIFGVARSGTNLVAGLLNASSQVAVALDPLLPLFKSLRDQWIANSNDQRLISRFPEGSPFSNYYFDEDGLNLMDLVFRGDFSTKVTCKKLVSKIVARAKLESPKLAKKLNGISGETFAELLDSTHLAILQLCDDIKKIQWTAIKEVWTTEFIPSLADTYENAKFILVRRDPRGVLSSLLAMIDKNPSQAADIVSYMRSWRKDVAISEILLSDSKIRDRIMLVRYEDLVSNPSKVIAKLGVFLDLEFNCKDIRPVMGEGSDQFSNSSFAEFSEVSDASKNRWKIFLENKMISIIDYLCGPEMLLSGYPTQNRIGEVNTQALKKVLENLDEKNVSWYSSRGPTSKEVEAEAGRYKLLHNTRETVQEERTVRLNFLDRRIYQKAQTALKGKNIQLKVMK